MFVMSLELTHQIVFVMENITKKMECVSLVHINVRNVNLKQYVPYVQETENTYQIVLVN